MPYDLKTAVLLGVEAWDVKELPATFHDYDTEYEGKEGETLYYQLTETGKIIILFLWGDTGAGLHFLFTTIRRCTEKKWDYYHNSVGETFTIEIKEE
jgi:hypothetical protein